MEENASHWPVHRQTCRSQYSEAMSWHCELRASKHTSAWHLFINKLILRPVTSLRHQGGAKSFLRGAKFFTLCPIDLNYFQNIFPGFLGGFRRHCVPMVTGLLILNTYGSAPSLKLHCCYVRARSNMIRSLIMSYVPD